MLVLARESEHAQAGRRGATALLLLVAALALVLGDRTEEAFRQSLLVSEGDLTIFFHGWLSGSIMTAGIVLVAWPLIAAIWPRRRVQEATA